MLKSMLQDSFSCSACGPDLNTPTRLDPNEAATPGPLRVGNRTMRGSVRALSAPQPGMDRNHFGSGSSGVCRQKDYPKMPGSHICTTATWREESKQVGASTSAAQSRADRSPSPEVSPASRFVLAGTIADLSGRVPKSARSRHRDMCLQDLVSRRNQIRQEIELKQSQMTIKKKTLTRLQTDANEQNRYIVESAKCADNDLVVPETTDDLDQTQKRRWSDEANSELNSCRIELKQLEEVFCRIQTEIYYRTQLDSMHLFDTSSQPPSPNVETDMTKSCASNEMKSTTSSDSKICRVPEPHANVPIDQSSRWSKYGTEMEMQGSLEWWLDDSSPSGPKTYKRELSSHEPYATPESSMHREPHVSTYSVLKELVL